MKGVSMRKKAHEIIWFYVFEHLMINAGWVQTIVPNWTSVAISCFNNFIIWEKTLYRTRDLCTKPSVWNYLFCSLVRLFNCSGNFDVERWSSRSKARWYISLKILADRLIDSYRAQNAFEDAFLSQPEVLFRDFWGFDPQNMIFQGYDPPLGDESRMGWKKSRLTKWSTSL